MTDKTPENESVNEAEEILKAELARLQSGEACVEGDECPIHHRLDFEELNSHIEYGRIVTYDGDYVVITGDNPELDSPTVVLGLILGLYSKDNVPDKFETCILSVGTGSVGDLFKLTAADRDKAVRYIHTHSDWSGFKDQHEYALMGLREGLIDVSKSVLGKEE